MMDLLLQFQLFKKLCSSTFDLCEDPRKSGTLKTGRWARREISRNLAVANLTPNGWDREDKKCSLCAVQKTLLLIFAKFVLCLWFLIVTAACSQHGIGGCHMQHGIVIMRNKLPGENYSKSVCKWGGECRGLLGGGGFTGKGQFFFPSQSCEIFKCQSPGVEGTFPVVAQKFHSPFTSFPSDCVLPLSLIPRSSHPQNTFAQFLLPIRNKSFVTHSHITGTATQGTAQRSAFPATFLSFSPPQRKTSQYLWLPKGFVFD